MRRRLVRAVICLAAVLTVTLRAAAAPPEPTFRFNRVDLAFGPTAASPDGHLLAVGGNPLTLIQGMGVVPTILGGTEPLPAPILMLDARTGRQVGELAGHPLEVTGLAFSPDGKRLVSSGHEEQVRIWDVVTRKCVVVCQGHTDRVSHVAFSPDGRRLASTSWDKTVRLWDAATGRQVASFDGESPNEIAFSRDGAHLIADGREGHLNVWDVATRTRTRRLHVTDDRAPIMAVSPDGKLVAAGGAEKQARLVEFATGRIVHALAVDEDGIGCLAFSPDGKLLATVSGPVRLWDVTTGKCRATLRTEPFAVGSVAFSPDGRTLLTAGPATIRGWSVRDLLGVGGAGAEAFSHAELAALRRDGAAQRRAADADLMAAARAATPGGVVLTPDEAVKQPRKRATVVLQASPSTYSHDKEGRSVTEFQLSGGNTRSLVQITISEDDVKRFQPDPRAGWLNYYGTKWVAVTGDITLDEPLTTADGEQTRFAKMVVKEQKQIVVLQRKVSPITWLDLLPPPQAPATLGPPGVTPVPPPPGR
jgi:WD40 repeat protein